MKKKSRKPTKTQERNFLLSMLDYALMSVEPKIPNRPTKAELFEFLFPEPLDPETRKLERKLNRLHDQLLRIPLAKAKQRTAR